MYPCIWTGVSQGQVQECGFALDPPVPTLQVKTLQIHTKLRMLFYSFPI